MGNVLQKDSINKEIGIKNTDIERGIICNVYIGVVRK